MTMTRTERLAYARGYNRARSRASSVWQRLAQIARGYRSRLADTPSRRACEDCQRWSRGHDNPAVKWGYCDTEDFNGHEPRMWSDLHVGEREPRRVVTQAEFGCVNWLPAERRAEVRAMSEQDR